MGRPRAMPPAGVFRAALRALQQVEPGDAARLVGHHGALQLRPHSPGTDPIAHPQDVIYVVATGRGVFHRTAARAPFAPGDAIFVPAGERHRFEDGAAEALSVWIAWWGDDPAAR